jgi:hypothetical protein
MNLLNTGGGGRGSDDINEKSFYIEKKYWVRG